MLTQQRRVARGIGLAGLVVAIAVAWGGCTTIKSIVSRPPAPKVTIPPPPPVKKEPEAPQPAKKEPEAPQTTKEPPSTKAPAPPPPVKKEPEAPQPAKKEPEATPTKKEPETAPPVLAPQVGKGDEEQLKRTAGSRIQRTEELIRQLDGKKLTHDQREQLLTVQNLLGSAKEALAAQDLAKASNLAEKARILAEELTQAVK